MKSSESIKELAEALASAQAELKPAPFDKENEFAGYKYASLNSVIEVAKKVLPKYGLSVSQVPVYETVDEIYYAGVETMLMHKSGEWISERLLVPVVSHGRLIELTIATDQKGKQSLGKTNVVQEMGKVITYCRRYAYAAIIGISSDEDTDGGEVKGRASVENEPQKAEPISHQKVTEEYMDLDEAYAVTNSEGVPYGKLPAKTLQNMSIGINKALKNPNLSPEEKAEYQRKFKAIGILLKAKSEGVIE